MEYVAIITSILLALLTALYVILTYRLVKETRRATDQTRALFEKQFLLSTLPHLHISISCDKTIPSITIYNSGDIAAYDVDLLIVGNYSEEDMDIPTFMVNYVVPTHRKVEYKATDEGFYGVYDHLFYPIFPQKRKVTAQLDFPKPPLGMYCLLQFREVSGTNYSQVYWFHEREREGVRTYPLGAVDPKIITSSPRIDFDFVDEKRLLAENNQPIPKYVEDEFAEFWQASIPSGYTSVATFDVEDRGEWHDI